MAVGSYDHLCKAIVVGDAGVGKTALVSRFVNNTYDESMNISTIGVDFSLKLVTIPLDGVMKTIKLQIWDTAGQERFQSVVSSYYRHASIVIFVYDTTDATSFRRILYWLKQVQLHMNQDVVKVLIGTKIDREERRMVETDVAEQLAQNHGFAFFAEVSAKDNTAIDKVFVNATTLVVKKYFAEMKYTANTTSSTNTQTNPNSRVNLSPQITNNKRPNTIRNTHLSYHC